MMDHEETPCIMSFRLWKTGFDCPAIKLDCTVFVIAAFERSGHVVIGLRETRFEGDGSAEFDSGMVSVAASEVSQTERIVDSGRLGQVFERPAKLTNGLRPVAPPECLKTLLIMGLARSNVTRSFGAPAYKPGEENRQGHPSNQDGRSS